MASRYHMAVVVDVIADNHEDALAQAEMVVELTKDSLAAFPQMVSGCNIWVAEQYDVDDDGQRVLHLHPEDKPIEDES